MTDSLPQEPSASPRLCADQTNATPADSDTPVERATAPGVDQPPPPTPAPKGEGGLVTTRATPRQAPAAGAHVAPPPAPDDPLLAFAPVPHKQARWRKRPTPANAPSPATSPTGWRKRARRRMPGAMTAGQEVRGFSQSLS